jgi:hypothetical protein
MPQAAARGAFRHGVGGGGGVNSLLKFLQTHVKQVYQ